MPQLIDRFRSSTRGWLLGSFAGWGTCILLIGGFLTSFYFVAQGTLQGAALLAPVVLLAGLVIVAMRWIRNMSVTYELASDRLILYRGILRKSIDEIELYRVKDVRIDFSIINQIADIGTIGITSSDETTRSAPLLIADVPRARKRREELRDLVDAARRQRGVREFDMTRESFGVPEQDQ